MTLVLFCDKINTKLDRNGLDNIMSRYVKPPRGGNSILTTIIGVIIFIALLESLLGIILPIILIGGAGYLVYYLITKQTRLEKVNTKQRLQDLKDSIRLADRQVKLLDNYLDEKDYTQYVVVARQLLPKIQGIKDEVTDLKPKMDLKIYKRIFKKAENVENDILLQLDKLDVSPATPQTSSEEKELLQYAPELAKLYNNIQQDHLTILEKIEQADNKEELTALHEADMERFRDILEGYLKIKQSPKNYYNAEERLAQAKTAMEKFDLALDETLRKLNESDLKDFDISLRMMIDDDTNL